jgi:hypothetical protein
MIGDERGILVGSFSRTKISSSSQNKLKDISRLLLFLEFSERRQTTLLPCLQRSTPTIASRRLSIASDLEGDRMSEAVGKLFPHLGQARLRCEALADFVFSEHLGMHGMGQALCPVLHA